MGCGDSAKSSTINALPKHLVVPFDAFNVVNILPQHILHQLQESRGKRRGRAAEIQDWTFEIRHHLWIVIMHPVRIKLWCFPSLCNDGFNLVSRRRHDGEADPPTVTASIITEHFQKPVVARWEFGRCSR